MLPANAHILATDKLAVSVTECITGQNVLIKEFQNREALLEAIWASCHIPESFHPFDFFSWRKPPSSKSRTSYPEQDGVTFVEHPSLSGAYCDGGISANIPDVPGHDVLRVSVLHGPREPGLICRQENVWHTRVRPPGSVWMSGVRVYLSLSNLRAGVHAVGGNRPTLHDYFDSGCKDGEEFLRTL